MEAPVPPPKTATVWVPPYDGSQAVYDFDVGVHGFRWRFKGDELINFVVYELGPDGPRAMPRGPARDAAIEELRHAA